MVKIPLTRPYMDDDIKTDVNAVLDSGYLTEGPVTRAFEDAIRRRVGCEHCLAVTSCTVGLELALRALGIGAGDEVIVPDFTYPATASVVAIVGAVPVLVDVDRNSMLMDYHAIEGAITERTRAIMPVSAFGNPLDYEQLDEIKQRHGLRIVEDAAPSLGAIYRGKPVGNWADITVFSFHPRKFITTGEGGAITTNNSEWAAWMKSYKHFGMETGGPAGLPAFLRIGTNYKLSDILAAVGLGQMRKMDELLARRLESAQRYTELLADVPGVRLSETTAGGVHSRQSYCVFVDQRDKVLTRMRSEGIEVQIGTFALHSEPAFRESGAVRHAGTFTGSDYAYEHCLTLPLFDGLTIANQETVVGALRELV